MRQEMAARQKRAESRLIVRLGEHIHQIRRALKLSQAQLAERLGRVKNTPISRLERGEARMIEIDLLDKLIQLADSAGFPPGWLCGAPGQALGFMAIGSNGLSTVTGSLRPGNQLRVGPVLLECTAWGRLRMSLGTTVIDLSLTAGATVPWVSQTQDGPHPVICPDTCDQSPLVVLGPGGSYRREIYPSDLTPQESDNVAGATAGPGA